LVDPRCALPAGGLPGQRASASDRAITSWCRCRRTAISQLCGTVGHPIVVEAGPAARVDGVHPILRTTRQPGRLDPRSWARDFAPTSCGPFKHSLRESQSAAIASAVLAAISPRTLGFGGGWFVLPTTQPTIYGAMTRATGARSAAARPPLRRWRGKATTPYPARLDSASAPHP
jgi:hypothetical protein